MNLSSRAGTYRVEVPFHDVDPARIVWHGHFYKYFEGARTELMRLHDLDVPDIVEMGYGMVVTETRCRYVSPARYGDDLLVRATFQEATHRLVIGYSVENLTRDELSARGRTGLVAVTQSLEFLTSLPDPIVERLTEEES